MTVSSLPTCYTSHAKAGSIPEGVPALHAEVSTRTFAVRLGKLGVSYCRQDVSLSPVLRVSARAGVAQDLELAGLTSHVAPFRPAGAEGMSAVVRRQGLAAYGRQTVTRRVVPPMIDTSV